LQNIRIARTGSLGKINMELVVPAKVCVRVPVERDSIYYLIAKVNIDFARRFDDGQIDASARRRDFGELIVKRDVDEVMCRAPRVDQALDASCECQGSKERKRKENFSREGAKTQRIFQHRYRIPSIRSAERSETARSLLSQSL